MSVVLNGSDLKPYLVAANAISKEDHAVVIVHKVVDPTMVDALVGTAVYRLNFDKPLTDVAPGTIIKFHVGTGQIVETTPGSVAAPPDAPKGGRSAPGRGLQASGMPSRTKTTATAVRSAHSPRQR